MLIPKKVKHRKWHKGRGRNIRIASSKVFLAFGSYGLKATTPAWLTSRQIEACRRVLTRYTRRGGKIWIRVFPDKQGRNPDQSPKQAMETVFFRQSYYTHMLSDPEMIFIEYGMGIVSHEPGKQCRMAFVTHGFVAQEKRIGAENDAAFAMNSFDNHRIVIPGIENPPIFIRFEK